MRSDRHRKRRKRNKWIKRIALIIFILGAFIFGTTVGYYGNQITNFLADVSEDTPEDLQDTSEQDESLAELHPISILLLGLDAEDEGEATRSDTIMVATINPHEESVKLVSIPRDTLITLPGSERQEKFNAVYPIYGMTGLVDFVEDYFSIPISYYATLNFDGLVDLVDAVDGITVNSDLSFTVQDSEENMDSIMIEEGIQELDGERALGYARMRKQDPRGDFGRQERQREVIESLANELLSFSSITNLTPILDAIRPNLQTNLSGQQIMTLASNYSSAAQNIETYEMTGQADYVYFPSYGLDLYVWLPYEENLREIKNNLQNHLELEVIPDEPNNLDGTIEEDDSWESPQEDLHEDTEEDPWAEPEGVPPEDENDFVP